MKAFIICLIIQVKQLSSWPYMTLINDLWSTTILILDRIEKLPDYRSLYNRCAARTLAFIVLRGLRLGKIIALIQVKTYLVAHLILAFIFYTLGQCQNI